MNLKHTREDVRFESVIAVEIWARENGGIREVSHLIVGSHFANARSRDYALEWTRQKERALADEQRRQEMALTLRSVRAAEKSAKFAFWAAVIAFVAAAVQAALPFIFPR